MSPLRQGMLLWGQFELIFRQESLEGMQTGDYLIDRVDSR